MVGVTIDTYRKGGNIHLSGNGGNGYHINGHASHAVAPEIYREGGFIEVYAGAMRTKKSSTLFERQDDLERAGVRVMVVKPDIDKRCALDKVMARDMPLRDCTPFPTAHPEAIFKLMGRYAKEHKAPPQVVVIEEAQFGGYNRKLGQFTQLPDGSYPMVHVVKALKTMGVHVIMSFLDQDYAGRTIGPSGDLLVAADSRQRMWGNCMYRESEQGHYCGKIGTRTQRLVLSRSQKEIPGFMRTDEGLYVPSHYNDRVIIIERNKKTENGQEKPRKYLYELRCEEHHFVRGVPTYYQEELDKLVRLYDRLGFKAAA